MADRVLPSRADVSMKVPQKALEMHANLVIQTDEESRLLMKRLEGEIHGVGS